jgi:hypothetical protein
VWVGLTLLGFRGRRRCSRRRRVRRSLPTAKVLAVELHNVEFVVGARDAGCHELVRNLDGKNNVLAYHPVQQERQYRGLQLTRF